MKKPTQHDKIIALCADKDWHCQTQFWNISKSPHKRRGEIEAMGLGKFEPRACVHGIVNSKDFRFNRIPQEKTINKVELIEVNGERKAVMREEKIYV